MSDSWDFKDKIEDMSPDEIEERIKSVIEIELAEKITVIPYVADQKESVEYRCPELTAKCPMTGLRDFYKITLRFVPNDLLPELKSLRTYYAAYDELPISHEHLAAKIFSDFRRRVRPEKANLVLEVAVRGGIATRVELGDKV